MMKFLPKVFTYLSKIANEFLEARTSLRTKQGAIGGKTKIKTDLEDINNTLKAIDKSGITTTIKSTDFFVEDQKPIKSFTELIDELKLALEQVKGSFTIPTIDTVNIQESHREEIESLIKNDKKS